MVLLASDAATVTEYQHCTRLAPTFHLNRWPVSPAQFHRSSGLEVYSVGTSCSKVQVQPLTPPRGGLSPGSGEIPGKWHDG